MSRKFWISAVAVGLTTASAVALADDRYDDYGDRYDDRYDERYQDRHESGYEYARVVDVEPLRRRVRTSQPVQDCWQERGYRSVDGLTSSNHIGGTLLGGLIGAALGYQVGDGRGRQVARAAGAIIGGVIGNNVSQQRQREHNGYDRSYERCETRYRDAYDERVDGYEVTYEYGGRQYVTRMPYDPGDRIRVRVDVSPAAG